MLHVIPQLPQFCVVLRAVSHPFAAFASQLPKPLLHAMLQAPPPQLAVPFVALHALPHVPQWETLPRTLVSQPLPALPSQLPNPALQAIVQTEPTQLGVPFVALHAAPHPPQCCTLLLVLISQPSAAPPLQSAKGATHDPHPHVPPTQFGTPDGHEQTVPHAPQWVVVVFLFVSQPFCALPSQLPYGAVQVGEQAPATHAVLPFALVQAELHAPQWPAVVCRFVSHPFDAIPSQLPKPALQAPSWQAPPKHVADALAKLHTALHAPQ